MGVSGSKRTTIALDHGSAHILDNRARRVIPMNHCFLLDPVYGINVGERAVWTGVLVDSVGRPRRA